MKTQLRVEIFQVLAFILVARYTCAQEMCDGASSFAETEPCCDGNHNVVKLDYKRSVRYQAESDDYICDRYITEGWYSFEGPSGDIMPTEAPPLESCGTYFPIWLNGTIPEPEAGIVHRNACLVDWIEPCATVYNIMVRNCNGEKVLYHLVPTLSCPEAYCIGYEIPCPGNSSSETGFTPNCTTEGFPVLYTDPVIDFTVEAKDGRKMVVFLCNLIHDEDIYLDVYWLIGEDIKVQHVGDGAKKYSEFPQKLFEDEWEDTDAQDQLDKNVTCILRPRYSQTSVPGDARTASYYMGFEVKGEFLTVVEGQEPAYYYVRPTIPILCPAEDISVCGVPIEIYEPLITDGGAPVCPSGHSKKIKQTAVKKESRTHTPCAYYVGPIENPDKDLWYNISIYGAPDGVYDGTQNLKLELRTTSVVRTHPIWQGYRLPSTQVTVLDEDRDIAGMFCKARHDPHMMTFDGRCYESHREGEFVLYRHTTLPIDVHAYFIKEREDRHYTTVCGAAVRAGGDLFVVENCGEGSSGRVRLYECDDMTLKITEIDEFNYKVSLPTGMYVLISLSSKYIEVHPSTADIDKTLGLCGTFTFKCDDDFVLPDGTYSNEEGTKEECDRTKPDSVCDVNDFAPNVFSDKWRIEDEANSLFYGNIIDGDRMDGTSYCSCNEETGEAVCGVSEIYCDFSEDDISERCYERNEDLRKYGKVYTDDVEDEIVMFNYDKNYTAPFPEWSDGWTQETAEQNCTGYIESWEGMNVCKDLEHLDFASATSDCIRDIKIVKSPIFNLIHLSALVSGCQKEISRNMSFYTFNNDTGETTPPDDMLDNICTSDCYKQGDCVDGECQCYEGFVGKTCALNTNQIPAINPLPQGGKCDLQSRPCGKTPVQGYYFIRTTNLVCQMVPITVSVGGEYVNHGTVVVKAEYEHLQRVFCPVPLIQTSTTSYVVEDAVLATGYIVSVSNNADDFSNEEELVVYDSTCMDCDKRLNCSLKTATCFIEESCYLSGETAPMKSYPQHVYSNPGCLVCDPKSNVYEWTKVQSNECSPSPANGWIIGGSILLVVAVAATVVIIGVVIGQKKKHTRVGTSAVELAGPDYPMAAE